MAQFDVFQDREGGLLIDCQSDQLRHLNSRLVVPLMPLDVAPTPAARLNPLFDVEGERLSMVTQFAATVPATELRSQIASLEAHRYEITGALDVLISG